MGFKRLIVPERVQVVPAQFSWVDHRLVRDRHIERCDPQAAALYLFLVTVADARGLSYYAGGTLARRLSMSVERLAAARADLVRAGLVAYAAPLYQVLALDPPAPAPAVQAPTAAPAPTAPVPQLSRQELRGRLAQLRRSLEARR